MHQSVGAAHPQGMMPHPGMPFPYPLRPFDAGVQIHPAFMHHSYPFHAAAGGLLAIRPGAADKGKSFTIDAILGKGGKEEDEETNTTPTSCSNNISGMFRSDLLRMRRQERMESTHPYMTCPPMAWRLSHTHLPGVGKDGIEKKSGHGMSGGASSHEWKHGKNKRVRTIFTPEQLERLETEFERQQYMVGTERYYLAASLNLTEAQVKVWFQNRRIKWRKHNLEKQHARLAKLELFSNEDGSESEPETELGSPGSGAVDQDRSDDFPHQGLAESCTPHSSPISANANPHDSVVFSSGDDS